MSGGLRIWARRAGMGLALGVLVAVGVVGLVLVVEPEFDLSGFRSSINSFASRHLGRDVQFRGPIRVGLGRRLRADLTDLSVANPEWATGAQLVSARQLRVSVDLAALFHGVVHLQNVEVEGVAVALEVSDSGQRTWSFVEPAVSGAEPRAASTGPALRYVVQDLALRDIAVLYQQADVEQPVRLQVDQLSQRDDDGMLMVDAEGQLNALSLRLNGRVGPLEALVARREISTDLRIDLGDTVVEVKGLFGDPQKLEDMELVAALRGPSLAKLLEGLKISYLGPSDIGRELDRELDREIDLRATVTDLEHGFAWTTDGHLGPFNVTSKGALEKPLEFDDLNVNLSVDGEDLASLGAIFGVPALPRQSYRMTGVIARADAGLNLNDFLVETGEARLTASGAFPRFPILTMASSKLALSVPNPSLYLGAQVPGLQALGPLKVMAQLLAQSESSEHLDVSIELGKNTARLDGLMGSPPYFGGTELRFDLSGPDIALVAATAGLEGIPEGAYAIAGTAKVDADGTVSVDIPESTAGNVRATAKGVLGKIPEMDGADLAVTVAGKSLHATAAQLSGMALPELPFRAGMRLSGILARPGIHDLNLKLGQASLALKGKLGGPPTFDGTDAQLTLDVPNTAELFPDSVSTGEWATQAYRASGGLKLDQGTLRLRDLKVHGDDLNGTLNATAQVANPLHGAKLAIEVKGPNLATALSVLPALADYSPPALAFNAKAKLTTSKTVLAIESLAGTVGEIRLTASGKLPLSDKQAGTALEVAIRGPHLADVGTVTGLRLPKDSFALSTRLTGSPKRWTMEPLKGELGKATVSGSLSIAPGERPSVNADLTARKLDLRPFLDGTGSTKEPSASAANESDANASRSTGRRLIPDTEPKLDFLDLANGEFRLIATELIFPDPKFTNATAISAVEIEGSLDNGNLTVKQFKLNGDRGKVTGSGTVKRNGGAVDTQWLMKGEDFRFGFMTDKTGLAALPVHAFDLSLAGRGSTYRQLAASLDGKIRLTGGKGQTGNTDALGNAMGSLLESLISAINPFRKEEPYTQIECTAAAIDIAKGVARTAPGFVIRTDKLDIVAAGNINLHNEIIDLQFKNSPRRGLGLSAVGLINPYVGVDGSLAEPTVQLDAPQALVSGGAAVATAGISALVTSVLSRLSTPTDLCAEVMNQATK